MKKPIRRPAQRAVELTNIRNLKMARSAHRYVRGSTAQFYAWLNGLKRGTVPEGPKIWICGDCHVGNLGPVADHNGIIEVQIRDLDQAVIGNPAHDLIRLGLSLASAARSSDLPGVLTARMLESLMEGYEGAFDAGADPIAEHPMPAPIGAAMRRSMNANWKTLAADRIDDATPEIPLGRRFWPVSRDERRSIEALVASDAIHRLATRLRSREPDSIVRLEDAAFWVKGCSSLGRLRFALILSIRQSRKGRPEYCLMDIKEAVRADAPHAANAPLPRQQARRVIAGARSLSPHLGNRMAPARLMNRSVFVRELLPQDLKIELDQLSVDSATEVAAYLAAVVGRAHARQMDPRRRSAWLNELKSRRSTLIDAPTWLWTCVVDLLGIHETAYLEHCRRYAHQKKGGS